MNYQKKIGVVLNTIKSFVKVDSVAFIIPSVVPETIMRLMV
jgi:hypothetical protein